MKSKEKIKKLENLVNQVFQGDFKIYILFKDTETNIYQHKNKSNETEYYKSKEDFIKRNGLTENVNILIIEIV